MTWDRVPGMSIKHHHGRRPVEYIADGEHIPEGVWKRRYVRALEAELDELHGKLAKIYEII